jgi:hypothetical protein
MEPDLERQLLAFGETLRHETGEPIAPPAADVVPLTDRPRRWVAVAGAAACVAAAVTFIVWIGRDGNGPAVTPVDVPATAPQTAPPDTTLPSDTTTPTSDSTPPSESTTPQTANPDDGASARISGRSIQFPDCPLLSFGELPQGWSEAIEPSSSEPGAGTLAGPNAGHLAISTHQPGTSSGTSAEVAGYPALANAGTRTVFVNRRTCGDITLSFTGADAGAIDAVLGAISLDDRALTDTAHPMSMTAAMNVFGRGLFEHVDVDPFVEVVSSTFGPPDSDTGWIAAPASFGQCSDAEQYRSIFWGDLRVVFERTGRREELTAWSVGDQSVGIVAPPDAHVPTSSLGLVTTEGLAVGADVSVLDQFPNIGGPYENGQYFIPQGAVVAVASHDGLITGFGTGRTDCD